MTTQTAELAFQDHTEPVVCTTKEDFYALVKEYFADVGPHVVFRSPTLCWAPIKIGDVQTIAVLYTEDEVIDNRQDVMFIHVTQ